MECFCLKHCSTWEKQHTSEIVLPGFIYVNCKYRENWSVRWKPQCLGTARGLKGDSGRGRDVLYLILGMYHFQALVNWVFKVCAFYCRLIIVQWNNILAITIEVHMREWKGILKLALFVDDVVYTDLSSPKYINNAIKMKEMFSKMAYHLPHWVRLHWHCCTQTDHSKEV